jgi:drug/metabolite transporter (DMT)-like permease
VRYIWHSWGSVTLLFLFSVPLAALLAWFWARLRSRRGVSARDALAEALMVAGTAPWLGPLLVRNPNPRAPRLVYLIPFVDLSEQIAKGPRYLAIELGGNLAVFAVLGFFMPIRYRVGPLAVALVAGTASAGVEVVQYLFDLHRTSSIDDVIINTTGAVLAALASRRWWRRRRSGRHAAGAGGAGPDAAGISSGERSPGMRSARG